MPKCFRTAHCSRQSMRISSAASRRFKFSFIQNPQEEPQRKGTPKKNKKKEPFSGSPKRNAKVEDDLTSLSFRPLKRNSNEEVPQRGTLKQEPFSGTLYRNTKVEEGSLSLSFRTPKRSPQLEEPQRRTLKESEHKKPLQR
jgi:hypothetical protein